MASINDLSLAKGLTAKVEDACAGLETGEAPILARIIHQRWSEGLAGVV